MTVLDSLREGIRSWWCSPYEQDQCPYKKRHKTALCVLSNMWRHNRKQVLTRCDFDFLFVREEELLSQSMLQPDVVPLLSRHFDVPIIHQAVELSVELQERVLSAGNGKGKN